MDIKKGIELFNDGSFFEAHDYFEEMWNEAGRGEKEFYQGLVQISVGSYHLICGNYKGALSQLNKGMSKLVKFNPDKEGINLYKLLSEINILVDKIIMYNSKKISNIELEKFPIMKKMPVKTN